MAQLFHRGSNSLSKAALGGALLLACAIAAAFNFWYRSPYVYEQRVAREQPVPFSHKHHVGEVGLDCRFCHSSVEDSSFAGIPPVSTCMTCHSQLFTSSPMLEPVREAARTGGPLSWVRVNSVPGFVYFDHGIHVHKGIGCATCHGPVDRMPMTWRQNTLEMRWCLSCHRDPAAYVRPVSEEFSMDYRPPAGQLELGRRLVAEHHIQKLTDCVTCHR